MSVAEFSKVTKYVVFDEELGKVEFDHRAEGEAFMEIIELFRTAFALHAHDPVPTSMNGYASSVQELKWKGLQDSEDWVTFTCYAFSKIHHDVFDEYKDLIASGLSDLEIKNFGDSKYIFQCHCPSER